MLGQYRVQAIRRLSANADCGRRPTMQNCLGQQGGRPIPTLLRSFVLAAILVTLPVGPDPAAAADCALAAALNGSSIQILQGKDFKELRRGMIAGAKLLNSCTLRFRLRRMAQLETVSLGKLHFVQGDGVSIDIASQTGEQREYIIRVGERQYAQAFQLLTSHARSCGANLVGPPPIVTTGE